MWAEAVASLFQTHTAAPQETMFSGRRDKERIYDHDQVAQRFGTTKHVLYGQLQFRGRLFLLVAVAAMAQMQ